MDRRKVIKTLGISAALVTTGFIAACNDTGKEAEKELEELKDSLKKANNKLFSERDKKIVNRNKMAIKESENPTKAELKHTPEIKLGRTDNL